MLVKLTPGVIQFRVGQQLGGWTYKKGWQAQFYLGFRQGFQPATRTDIHCQDDNPVFTYLYTDLLTWLLTLLVSGQDLDEKNVLPNLQTLGICLITMQ